MIEPFLFGMATGCVVWYFWGRRICELVSQVLPYLWPK